MMNSLRSKRTSCKTSFQFYAKLGPNLTVRRCPLTRLPIKSTVH